MTHDVIVLGGGTAGLSAAVDLASHGHRILLLEQKPHLGGRTYSFTDKHTGDAVDNGQHLLMGCYHATQRYLESIGSVHLAHLQPNLHIGFLHPVNGFAALSCPPLAAPLHVLVGLLRLKTLPFSHRLRLLRIGSELLASSVQKERQLEQMTVDQWLRSLGQTPENRKYLWDILAVGTLNDDPAKVSALLFYRVLKAAFLGTRRNSCLLIPKVGLSDLLVEPAVRFLESRGSEVRSGAGVETIITRNGVVTGVKARRKTFTGRAYVSAVPYHALHALQETWRKEDLLVDQLSAFESSPIITLHLWFDRQVLEQEFVATLDSTIQWIFNRTRMIHGENVPGRQYLSVVISGASAYVAWPKEKLVRLAIKELRDLLPHARDAKIVRSLVIKEKRATFLPAPGMEHIRPPIKTAAPNFFLAGDWTGTGFPATIEGAVLSGFSASAAVRRYLGE